MGWLGAGIDPDGYLQIPSHHDMEGQEQDGMEVCGWQMKYVRELDLAMCVSPSSNGSKMRSLWTNQMKS